VFSFALLGVDMKLIIELDKTDGLTIRSNVNQIIKEASGKDKICLSYYLGDLRAKLSQFEKVNVKHCPRCKKNQRVDLYFGYRMLRGKKVPQSYCITCRGKPSNKKQIDDYKKSYKNAFGVEP
jgi:hypothetical protein